MIREKSCIVSRGNCIIAVLVRTHTKYTQHLVEVGEKRETLVGLAHANLQCISTASPSGEHVTMIAFLPYADFFSKFTFHKTSFRNAIRVSKSLNPNQAKGYVGPDLGPN